MKERSDPIKVLIVDDEELARLRLRKLIQKEPDTVLIGECVNGVEAVERIRADKPHLVFLDVQMQRMDGFDVIEHLEGEDTLPIIIFVTAYDQYAVRAFDASALDYLLKPFGDQRFKQAVDKARQRLRDHQIGEYADRLLRLLQDYKHAHERLEENQVEEPTEYSGRLVLKTDGRLIFLDAEKVDWIEAEGVYVRIHIATKSHLLRESLSNVEARLDPRVFMRIHRSTIVNVHRIKEIIPHFNGGAIVALHDGTQLKLSRSYRDRVSATLG